MAKTRGTSYGGEQFLDENSALSDASSHQQTWQRRGERRDAVENRKRILSVTRQMFAEQGVSATSMNEIAQVAQVGPGTLYRHFAHKGELCEALLQDDLIAFWERIDATLESDPAGSALDQLGWFIDELIRMTDSHLPLLAAYGEAMKLRPQEIFHAPFFRGMYKRITSLLTKALAQGETADLDIAFTADAILAVITPPLFDFQRQYRQFSCEQIAMGMRHLFIDGLRARAVN